MNKKRTAPLNSKHNTIALFSLIFTRTPLSKVEAKIPELAAATFLTHHKLEYIYYERYTLKSSALKTTFVELLQHLFNTLKDFLVVTVNVLKTVYRSYCPISKILVTSCE